MSANDVHLNMVTIERQCLVEGVESIVDLTRLTQCEGQFLIDVAQIGRVGIGLFQCMVQQL